MNYQDKYLKYKSKYLKKKYGHNYIFKYKIDYNNNDLYYKHKYLKYKSKYLDLKQKQLEGGFFSNIFKALFSRSQKPPKDKFYADSMRAHFIKTQISSPEDIPINKIIFDNNILENIQKESKKQKKIADAIKTVLDKKKDILSQYPQYTFQNYLVGQVQNFNFTYKKNII